MREVGPEAFELGLLIAIETESCEEEAHVFTFRHLLLLEFVAAKYVTILSMVGRDTVWPFCPISFICVENFHRKNLFLGLKCITQVTIKLCFLISIHTQLRR